MDSNRRRALITSRSASAPSLALQIGTPSRVTGYVVPMQNEFVAFHEAGHAVIAAVQGNMVRAPGVRVELAAPAGHAQIRSRCVPCIIQMMLDSDDANVQSRALIHIEQDVRESLAGPVAEAIYTKVRLTGLIEGFDDTVEAAETLALFHDDPVMRQIAQFQLQQETARILRRRSNWNAVTVLADLLMRQGTVSAEDANALLGLMIRRRRLRVWN